MRTTAPHRSTMLWLLLLLGAQFRPSKAFAGPFASPPQIPQTPQIPLPSRTLPPSQLTALAAAQPNDANDDNGGGGGGGAGDGDFHLFDPDAEGKLQGTGSLAERLRLGADYGGTAAAAEEEEEEEISPALRQLMELAKSGYEDGGDGGGQGGQAVEKRVNLGAAMLASSESPAGIGSAGSAGADVPAIDTFSADSPSTGTSSSAPPPADGIVLELDASGEAGNPAADPAKVQILQQQPNQQRSVAAPDDVPARILFRDVTTRIPKHLRLHLLDQPNHFQLVLSDPDPSQDSRKKHIEYQPHLLTAVKRYRVVRTWDLARRSLEQQGGLIGGNFGGGGGGGLGGGAGAAVMQAGSFPTAVQTGVVTAPPSPSAADDDSDDADDARTTIDVHFDPTGWLESILVDGRTVVTAAGYLDSTYEEAERFVCYPEMYLRGRVVVEDMSFY